MVADGMMGEQMAVSDCAAMMAMAGSDGTMDCAAVNDEGAPNAPAKCKASDCNLRCGPICAFQIVVSFSDHTFPLSMPALGPDSPQLASTAGKPPLPPPRT